jgi:hypothetical protein
MRARFAAFAAALAAVSAAAAVPSAGAGAGAPTSCRAAHWCTITSDGISSSVAAQFAIGNVPRGTGLAITQDDVKHQQVGGQIIDGELAGTCAWSQYQRDWAPLVLAAVRACPEPVYLNSQFIADDGRAIWSGCYERCFGGVPMVHDRRCGRHGRTFCYSSNCEEYANFYPWTANAHPTDPLRSTQGHKLDVRYLARYGDVWTDSPFYMVRDEAVGHGQADWVFISGRACGVVPGHAGSYHTLPRHQ